MSGDRYFIRNQQAIYFLTFTIVNWLDVFTRLNQKQVVVDSLNYCICEKGLKVYAWCLMSSHLHLVAAAKEGHEMSAIVRDFKKHTAKNIIEQIKEEPESRREYLLNQFIEAGKNDKRITTYKFWQESNHAIGLEPGDIKMMDQKIEYIHQNPVKEGIVEQAEYYLYSSAKDFAGETGLVKIEPL